MTAAEILSAIAAAGSLGVLVLSWIMGRAYQFRCRQIAELLDGMNARIGFLEQQGDARELDRARVQDFHSKRIDDLDRRLRRSTL